MSKFKVGDKVRYIMGRHEDLGHEGIITVDETANARGTVIKLTEVPNGSDYFVGEYFDRDRDGFELVEQGYTFDDVRIGDHVRTVRTYSAGTVVTREGVVTAVGTTGSVLTADDVPLYTPAHREQYTIELIDRPVFRADHAPSFSVVKFRGILYTKISGVWHGTNGYTHDNVEFASFGLVSEYIKLNNKELY